MEAVWFSRLGQDEFGAFVRNQVRAEGVDCRAVVFDETHPTGLMFKQTGAGESRVYYYRAGSAASFLSPGDITPALFAGVGLLHLTGITPVLSENCRAAVLRAFALADELGVPVSFDPNIRRKLWNGVDHTPLLRDLALRSTVQMCIRDRREIRELNIKTPDSDKLIAQLSGGNQQKVILARWLETHPKVLILDEPTKGIDVGAKAEFYRIITECAAQGMAVIVISSELPEIIGLSDRILVMREGRISGEVARPDFSEEVILKYAMTDTSQSEQQEGPQQ